MKQAVAVDGFDAIAGVAARRSNAPPLRTAVRRRAEWQACFREHLKGKSLRKLAESYGVSLWAEHSACHAETAEGIKRIRRAVTKHGRYSKVAREERNRIRALIGGSKTLLSRIAESLSD